MPGIVCGPRGCGASRKPGGCYAESGMGPEGLPVEYFLMDPPIPVPPGLHIGARGVQLLEKDGVWHIVDRIGLQFYPNVVDIVEEIRRMGLSRRLQKTLDFSKLDENSRILLVHDRALIQNAGEWKQGEPPYWKCPKKIEEHERETFGGCCAGIWWQDIEEGQPYDPEDPRKVARGMPSFVYSGRCRPEGVEPEYIPAFFASFPITRIAVVKGSGSEETLEKARKAKLPVEEAVE